MNTPSTLEQYARRAWGSGVITDEIKEAYGVGIEDFASAIETLKEEQEKQLQKLEELVNNAEKQVGV